MKIKRALVTSKGKAEIVNVEFDESALKPSDIAGKTLYTLISAGTELNCVYVPPNDRSYPAAVGYAAVFQVEYTGSEVVGFKKGDLAFCCGLHQSYQYIDYREAVLVPEGIKTEEVPFCRMGGVSAATLYYTNTKPAQKVLVSGLGAVGLLAAQIYKNCGYYVTGIEPIHERAEIARKIGFGEVYETFPTDNCELAGKIQLALECSGTQQGAMGCCDMLCTGAEMSLVGVPWRKTADTDAFDLLNKIFFKYITVYSGWEHRVPFTESTFNYTNQLSNYLRILNWIKDGSISLNCMYAIKPYCDIDTAYKQILDKTEKHPSTVLDWTDK